MTIIRKIAFVTVSISAFIYLVLQTSQGQIWLNKSHQSWFGEPTKEASATSSNAHKEDALTDSFMQFLKDSEQAKKMAELELQLNDMRTVIADITAGMHELTALNITLHEQNQLLDNAQRQTLLADNTLAKEFAQPTKFQQTNALPLQFDEPQNAPVEQTVASSKSSKTDARQRQLEQQARLQEVVQRMELTALQAISR